MLSSAHDMLMVLGIPPSAPWIRVASAGAISERSSAVRLIAETAAGHAIFSAPVGLFKGWDGYSLLLLGIITDTPAVDPDWPIWKFDLHDRTVTIQTWFQRVRRSGSPLVIMATWAPQRGSQVTMSALSPDWSEADLQYAGAALRLVDPHHGAGPSAQPAGMVLQELADAALALGEENLSRRALGEAFFIGEPAVDKRLQEAGVRNLGGLHAYLRDNYGWGRHAG